MAPLTIGFTYAEFAFANVIGLYTDAQDRQLELGVVDLDRLSMIYGITLSSAGVASAMSLVDRRKLVYGAFAPIHQIVLQLLESPDYFPEDPAAFEDIVFRGGARNPKQQSLLDAHSELFEFWKAFSVHKQSLSVLASLASLYGTEHSAIFDEEDWPCLYHQGMVDIDPEIRRIVDTYNHYKSFLGFSPALLPADCPSLPIVPELVVDIVGDSLTVSVPTLAGRIWFEGVPSKPLGGVKLKLV